MSDENIKVGISQGDINGIGLEVVLKTFLEPELCDICTPILFSSQKTVGFYRKVMGLEELNFNATRDLKQLNNKKPNVFVCYEEEVQIEMGNSTPTGGKYAQISLHKACEAAKQGLIDVLVTAPINKHNIQSEQFKYPGHSEFLASFFGFEKGAMMLMCSDELKVGLVTGHVPIQNISPLITQERLTDKLTHLNKTLKCDFALQKPKIAVLGLNPHAGDIGTLGTEDETIIKPVIEKLKNEMQVYGPYPADGFFGSGTYKKFDAVLAMYHDQGLIPFKTISFNNGVNFTTGLPIVRTSPDHGTAYDLAGKNIADAGSFRKAIYMAIDIYRNRKMYKESAANPLPFKAMSKSDAREN
ncbi:MAG TPA: 4-hydroxythreonine-4-phosphate dehydrogenase PdxA [Bacteroidia bacterium]|jgi:4-hydroxythreonine-4-phosphate dehydrogenase|nr:4-hydroxythreonine-4-phosphate dehydrogenase PdxA [Bacteroidia bacterium]